MHDDACQPQSPASDSAQWNLVESNLPTGHLSPISTGMDTSSNSGPSAHDTSLAMPKLEPLDEDFCLDNVTEAPAADLDHGNLSSTNPKQKRPRGRPRKHPLNSAINAGKVTKGRSKTGCITCRKRKKKCDEAKPRCMNCEKNAVVCEGYHEKKLWRSGKDKASDGHTEASEDATVLEALLYHTEASEDAVVFHMQPLFHGVVTVEDRLFWKHYYVSLSNVLTVEGEAKNAFKDIILPLANKHQGVMHSVLAMSKSRDLTRCLAEPSRLSPPGRYGLNPPEDPTYLAFITEFFQIGPRWLLLKPPASLVFLMGSFNTYLRLLQSRTPSVKTFTTVLKLGWTTISCGVHKRFKRPSSSGRQHGLQVIAGIGSGLCTNT
ncbi:Transcriptional regulatory protein moc3 like [Verticillium longisporum]|nr:Transcriptional regulatory protein moc3 like [Verticillium longisporum]